MRRYVVRRSADAVVTLIGVSLLVFFLLRILPGDEITARFGIEAGALTPGQIDALERYYGLDESLVEQYFGWLGSVLSGNFGISVTNGRPIGELIANALPVTIQLAVMSIVIGTAVGVAIGVMAASGANGPRDVFGQTFGLLGLGVPSFVIGSTIIAVLAGQFSYFPAAAAYANLWEDPLLNLQQLIFPAITLAIGLAASSMRTTRSAFLEASSQDFVRTARGKGLSPRRVKYRHILRNSLVPITTITGIQFGYLLGGTIIVEEIFALPGMGRLLLTGIAQREFAVVQSTVLVIAAMFVMVNLIVDLVYTRIDPRVKLS